MPQGDQNFDFRNLRGGRNGGDPPLEILPDQVNEAVNIDYEGAQVAHKRNGSSSLSLTFSSGGPFASGIMALGRHIPGFEETAAELWALSGDGVLGQLAAATTWVAKTLKAAFSATLYRVNFVSFNGKLHILGDTAANRTQIWTGSTIRYSGLGAPTSAVTNSGTSAGAVTDTRRYWSSVVEKSGSDYLRRSELTQNYLQIGLAAQQAAIALGGAPGEGETHWELWAATDDDGYSAQHYIGEAAIGNTISDNNAVLSGVGPALVGTYLPPPSARFALPDGDRILFGGNYESTSSFGQVPPKSSRVWWTPRLGDRDIGDDERIVITAGTASVPAIKNYTDIDRALTGLGGPIGGSPIAFSYRKMWRLSPTGVITSPYRRIPLDVPYGCIFDKSIVSGEDEEGNGALYFWTHMGPARIDSGGPVLCNWDVQDIVCNQAANVPAHGVFHSDKHQIWYWVATGSSTYPDTILVFHTREGRRVANKVIIRGWTKYTGDVAGAICSVMFSNTVGATMSRDLKPYLGRSTGTTILKGDDSAQETDAGTAYSGYIEKVIGPPQGFAAQFRLGNAYIGANARVSGSLRQTVTPDFGKRQAVSRDVSLIATGSETKIFRQIEDSAVSGLEQSATVRLGDLGSVTPFTLDRWKIMLDKEASQ